MPWFRELSAEDRSWVGMIVQAGIRGFVDWYREPDEPAPPAPTGRRRSSAPRPARWPASSTSSRPSSWSGSRSRWSRRTSTSSLDPERRRRRARRGAALRPRGRVRHRRGLRPRRRGARRLGRPARGAGRRRGAARRGRRGGAAPGPARSAGAAAATWPWCSGARARPERTRDRRLRRGTPRRPGPPASTRCAPSRATGSWSSSAASTTPTRRPPRDRRPTSATGPVVVGPVADDLAQAPRLGPGRARRPTGPPPAGPRRPARCAATTCCPSGRWPATATPAGSWSTRSTCRCCDARGTLLETLDGVLRPRRLDRGDRPRAVRAPQHRPLPAQAGRRGHRPRPDRRPRRLHPRGSRSIARPASPAASDAAATAFVGILQRSPRRFSCAPRARDRRPRPRQSGRVLVIVAPGQGAQTPGFLDALARGPDVRRPARAGCPPSPASTWPTTAPRPTPRRSATPRSPSRCWSPPAWSPPSSCSRTRPTRSAGRRGRRPQRRRDRRRRRRPGDHRRAGDGAGPRARQGDGRGRRRRPRPA